ncbi:four helix bundle protein [Nubsella zeaxanthinifaciens]|jgi:four helix bundle protein|uniref:four helix bundle protein n=1 Tax=Nubsella zeaxanthinifaciens TaxID=392412 RepID=UPI000DE2464E|nr:four helix bundle protein [Nubsella zeaxanthinifaciens]
MAIKCFEDIVAWQKAQDFSVFIYKSFGDLKDWDFRSQICRASVSISNNIAEGFDRGTKPEFKRFLYISLASTSEVKSMLYLAKRLNYVDEITFITLLSQAQEISKITNGLIKSIA